MASRLRISAALAAIFILTHAFTDCARPIDLMYVLDGSGSIGTSNWLLMEKMTCEMSDLFHMEYVGGAQLGVIQYSSSAVIEIPLGKFKTNHTSYCSAVYGMPYRMGNTNTDRGIVAAQQQLDRFGRLASTASSHAMLVVTDGMSTVPAATLAAANAARAAGTWVAAMAVGSWANSDAARTELMNIAGGDTSMIFQISDWNILTRADLLQNLTEALCDHPAIMPNLTAVNAKLQCNQTLYLQYTVNATSPLHMIAHTTQRTGLALCYSYTNMNPLPIFLLPAGSQPQPNVSCVIVAGGDDSIISETAFPPPNATRVAGSRTMTTLYISVTSFPGTVNSSGVVSTVCGSDFALRPSYCSFSRLTWDVPYFPGMNTSLFTSRTNATILVDGDASVPACPYCPDGMDFLGVPGRLQSVCAPSCPPDSFWNLTGTVPVCTQCDASCGTCVHPGGPRSCTSCPAIDGTLLLPNTADPAWTSPMWSQLNAASTQGGLYGALGTLFSAWVDDPARTALLPPPPSSPLARGAVMTDGGVLLNMTAGRCVAACPRATDTGVDVYAVQGAASRRLHGDGDGVRAFVARTAPALRASTAKIREWTGPSGALAASARQLDGLPAPGSPACSPDLNSTLAATSTTVLITLCANVSMFTNQTAGRSLALPSSAWAFNGSMVRCASFASSTARIQLAASLANDLGVPAAAIFLRSCLDLDTATRMTWAYNATSLTVAGDPSLNVPAATGIAFNAAVPPIPFGSTASYDLRSAFYNQTGYAAPGTAYTYPATSTCNCSALVTFAYIPAVAAPGELQTLAYATSAAMTNVTIDSTTVVARASAALAVLASTLAYIPSPADLGRGGPSAPVSLAANCSVASERGGWAAFGAGACIDAATPVTSTIDFNETAPTTSDGLQTDYTHRDPLTACPGFLPAYVAPSPSVTPSATATPTLSLTTSATPTSSITPSATVSPSVTGSVTASASASITPSITSSPSASATASVSPTGSATASATATVSTTLSPSPSASVHASNSVSPSHSPSHSASSTPTIHATAPTNATNGGAGGNGGGGGGGGTIIFIVTGVRISWQLSFPAMHVSDVANDTIAGLHLRNAFNCTTSALMRELHVTSIYNHWDTVKHNLTWQNPLNSLNASMLSAIPCPIDTFVIPVALPTTPATTPAPRRLGAAQYTSSKSHYTHRRGDRLLVGNITTTINATSTNELIVEMSVELDPTGVDHTNAHDVGVYYAHALTISRQVNALLNNATGNATHTLLEIALAPFFAHIASKRGVPPVDVDDIVVDTSTVGVWPPAAELAETLAVAAAAESAAAATSSQATDDSASKLHTILLGSLIPAGIVVAAIIVGLGYAQAQRRKKPISRSASVMDARKFGAARTGYNDGLGFAAGDTNGKELGDRQQSIREFVSPLAHRRRHGAAPVGVGIQGASAGAASQVVGIDGAAQAVKESGPAENQRRRLVIVPSQRNNLIGLQRTGSSLNVNANPMAVKQQVVKTELGRTASQRELAMLAAYVNQAATSLPRGDHGDEAADDEHAGDPSPDKPRKAKAIVPLASIELASKSRSLARQTTMARLQAATATQTHDVRAAMGVKAGPAAGESPSSAGVGRPPVVARTVSEGSGLQRGLSKRLDVKGRLTFEPARGSISSPRTDSAGVDVDAYGEGAAKSIDLVNPLRSSSSPSMGTGAGTSAPVARGAYIDALQQRKRRSTVTAGEPAAAAAGTSVEAAGGAGWLSFGKSRRRLDAGGAAGAGKSTRGTAAGGQSTRGFFASMFSTRNVIQAHPAAVGSEAGSAAADPVDVVVVPTSNPMLATGKGRLLASKRNLGVSRKSLNVTPS